MRRTIFVSLLVAIATLLMLHVNIVDAAFAQGFSPTPTYDPLVETPLPPNPTEFELGQNLYWHWCMTCHGDRGQGLTDDWRAVWVKDHQNCWGRGCHAGRNGDQGFPIPTVVPSIIGSGHLAQFATLQDLSDFLKTTHPPQHPGILKDEEYHAIAVYVFTLNSRSLASATPAPILAPAQFRSLTPTPTLARQGSLTTSALNPWFIIILASSMLAIFVALIRKSRVFKK
jgi:mono/diheme cytochrome c family protein